MSSLILGIKLQVRSVDCNRVNTWRGWGWEKVSGRVLIGGHMCSRSETGCKLKLQKQGKHDRESAKLLS